MTSQYTYANRKFLGTDAQIEITPTGKLPALVIDYPDGAQYVILITGASNFTFDDPQIIQWNLEQYMRNDKFNRWDKTNSSKFSDSLLTISNNFKVDANTGKWPNELTADQLKNANWIGEFNFWMSQLGKTVIIPALLKAAYKKFIA